MSGAIPERFPALAAADRTDELALLELEGLGERSVHLLHGVHAAKLKEALIDYPAPKRYGITFEYVMIEGDNDSIQDAKNLVRFLKGIKSKVNLIPINHFPGIEMRASEAASLHRFQDYLVERNVPTSIRYSRGQDISGGCGQLATKRHDELHLDPRQVQKERRQAQRRRAFSPVFPSASA